MAESETPRTDDETYLEPTDVALIGVPVVTAEFARQLERELHLKDQKIAELYTLIEKMDETQTVLHKTNIQWRESAESLQAKVAELEREEKAWPCCQDYDNCTTRCEPKAREFRARAESLQSQLAAAQEAIKGISLKQIEEFRREYWIPPSTHGEPLEEWAEKENSMLAAMCKLATLAAQGDPS